MPTGFVERLMLERDAFDPSRLRELVTPLVQAVGDGLMELGTATFDGDLVTGGTDPAIGLRVIGTSELPLPNGIGAAGELLVAVHPRLAGGREQ